MTSALLAPPTTVTEDDSLEEMEPQDENRPNWNNPKPMVLPDDDNDDASIPVEEMIQSFNDELDQLTKSMDNWLATDAVDLDKTMNTTETPYSSRHRDHYSLASTSSKRPLRDRDPPPSAARMSPLRNHYGSTPSRRSVSSHTPSEPPPVPVETPGLFQRSNPRRRSVEGPTHSTGGSRTPWGPTETYHFSSDNREESIENLKLRGVVREQERLIQELEIENNALRRQLQLDSKVQPHPPTVERVSRREDSANRDHLYESPYYRDVLETPTRRRPHAHPGGYPEEPKGRTPVPTSTPYSTNRMTSGQKARRGLRQSELATVTDAIEEVGGAFTPGTRFVAQLATLLKMENGHHAPLSVIMDKHWDELEHHFQHDSR